MRFVPYNFISFLVLFVCVINNFSIIKGQEYFSKSIDINQEGEAGWQIIQGEDDYYIMAPSYCDSNGYCTSIIKLNGELGVDWIQTFTGILPGSITSLVLQDSCLLLYGILFEPNDSLGLTVIKFNNHGDKIDQWYYGTANSDSPKGIVLIRDGFKIVVSESIGSNLNKLWIYTCNAKGAILSKKQYCDEYSHTNIYSILGSENSNIIMGGAGCFQQDCQSIEGFALIIDSLGDVSKKITNESMEVGIPPYTYAISGPNGFTYISRFTLSELSGLEIPIIYKYDSLGQEVWKHPIESEEYAELNRIKLTQDGDILGVGFNENHPYIDTTSNLRRELGGWVFRMSPEGEWVWNRIIGDLRFPRPGFGNILDVVETSESNFLAVGYILDTLVGSNPPQLSLNVWVLYFDSTGCIIPDCGMGFNGITAHTDLIEFKTGSIITIYPNPSNGLIHLRFNQPNIINQTVKIVIMDNLGRIMQKDSYYLNDYILPIDVSEFSSGLYYLTIIAELKTYSYPFILQ